VIPKAGWQIAACSGDPFPNDQHGGALSSQLGTRLVVVEPSERVMVCSTTQSA
jgi:hypothetical protein